MVDYSRQDATFNQDKLLASKVVVAGSGNLAQFFCLYAAGLGLGNIQLFPDGEGMFGNAYNLEERIKLINPDINFKVINHTFCEYFIGKPDVVLDLTNDKDIKKLTYKFVKDLSVQYIDASVNDKQACLKVFNNKLLTCLGLNDENEVVNTKEQGIVVSAFLAAIILDEVRKRIVGLQGDVLSSFKFYIDITSPRLVVDFNKFKLKNLLNDRMLDEPKLSKVLVVGAGGTGTYALLNLANYCESIDLFDGDVIEAHNLNRQVFYYNRIGQNKAKVLSDRVKELFDCKIVAHDRFFEKSDMKYIKNYDAVFSCVDNSMPRLLLNNMAIENKVKLYDTGVTINSARVEAYVPGRNICLRCRRGERYGKEFTGQRDSCATMIIPSVVMSNAIAGSMVVIGALYNHKLFEERIFNYSSQDTGSDKFQFKTIKNNYRPGSLCACRRDSKLLNTILN